MSDKEKGKGQSGEAYQDPNNEDIPPAKQRQGQR